jgi:hypothetical protein
MAERQMNHAQTVELAFSRSYPLSAVIIMSSKINSVLMIFGENDNEKKFLEIK